MIARLEWPITLRAASNASAIGGGPQRKITVSGPGGEVRAWYQATAYRTSRWHFGAGSWPPDWRDSH